jgi:uncharacterized protein (TIGR02217 family)
MEQLHHLIAFFRAVQGRKHSFLYYDWVDHTSTMAELTEARRAPDPSFDDQTIATGDGTTVAFQLNKTYETPGGTLTSVRPIYKPKDGTVMLGVDGAEVDNWTVDLTTGIVTFNSRITLSNLQVSLQETKTSYT